MEKDSFSILQQNLAEWLDENRFSFKEYISKSKKGNNFLLFDSNYNFSVQFIYDKKPKNKTLLYEFPAMDLIRYTYNVNASESFEVDGYIWQEVCVHIEEKILEAFEDFCS
ncbi:MAG: hypothetical protein H7A25_15135 [Leptospiraceae bacterium]|nr:hypothetical protein [Leptospiraceae bacterium]MCP5501233.1 hypothetical protein [Leptospiraceae bacterium]